MSEEQGIYETPGIEEYPAVLRENVLIEQELLEFLGIKQPALDRLRNNRAFPFVPITSRDRVYVVADVLKWITDNQVRKSIGKKPSA